MKLIEIILIGISLAMDAFAVSICKGISLKKIYFKLAIFLSLYFAVFQALMPYLGYNIASTFTDVVLKIDHYVAFILLSIIGISMIISYKENDEYDNDISFKTMILLAIATSIDAFAIGVTFAFLNTNLYLSLFIIFIITLILSTIGFILGNKISNKFQNKAKLFGGFLLIIIGIKILIEHLNILYVIL